MKETRWEGNERGEGKPDMLRDCFNLDRCHHGSRKWWLCEELGHYGCHLFHDAVVMSCCSKICHCGLLWKCQSYSQQGYNSRKHINSPLSKFLVNESFFSLNKPFETRVLLKQGLIISHSAVSSSLASWFLWPEHSNYISAVYVMSIHNFLQSFKTAFLYSIGQTCPTSLPVVCYSLHWLLQVVWLGA